MTTMNIQIELVEHIEFCGAIRDTYCLRAGNFYRTIEHTHKQGNDFFRIYDRCSGSWLSYRKTKQAAALGGCGVPAVILHYLENKLGLDLHLAIALLRAKEKSDIDDDAYVMFDKHKHLKQIDDDTFFTALDKSNMLW